MKNKARDFGFDRPIDFPRGSFDESQTRQGSYDIGPIYPVYAREMLPGENVKIGNTINLAFTETLSAIRHEVNAVIDWYFVPYGCLANITEAEKTMVTGLSDPEKMGYNDPRYGFRNSYFAKLITGGFDGNNVDTLQGYTPQAADLNVGSLWDALGLPMTIAGADYDSNKINIALFRAYEAIWNWNYRDQNWQSAYAPTGATVTVAGDPSMSIVPTPSPQPLLMADWEKDYFTTALKSQQRGPAQAVSVQGIGSAVWATATFPITSGGAGAVNVLTSDNAAAGENKFHVTNNAFAGGNATGQANMVGAFNANTILLTGLGVDISKLRTSIATQRVLERNSRAGARESEFYKAHYNDGPTDNRGDQPDFIGRYKQPIIFADVVNTSVAGAPASGTDPTIAVQTMGHRQTRGDASGAGQVGSYHVKEFGILMAMLIIRPRPMYYQTTKKFWFAGRGRFDFPLPEFANLSEQPVLTREVAPDTVATVGQVFGYQGRYDEYRQMMNDATGLLRNTGAAGATANLRSWNMGRSFTGTPVLGDTFLKVDPAIIKGNNFAYTNASIPMLIGTIGNIVEVSGSPIPQIAQPGLMDHI